MPDVLEHTVAIIARLSPIVFGLVSLVVTVGQLLLSRRLMRKEESEAKIAIERLTREMKESDEVFTVTIPAHLEGKTISSSLTRLIENLANSDVQFTVVMPKRDPDVRKSSERAE